MYYCMHNAIRHSVFRMLFIFYYLGTIDFSYVVGPGFFVVGKFKTEVHFKSSGFLTRVQLGPCCILGEYPAQSQLLPEAFENAFSFLKKFY